MGRATSQRGGSGGGASSGLSCTRRNWDAQVGCRGGRTGVRRRREASESGICARGRATSARSLTPLCPAHRACASTTSHTATARVKLARCTAPRRRHLSHSTSSSQTLEPCALLKQLVEQERVRSAQITVTSAPRDSASSCATTSTRGSRSRAKAERKRAREGRSRRSERGRRRRWKFRKMLLLLPPGPIQTLGTTRSRRRRP